MMPWGTIGMVVIAGLMLARPGMQDWATGVAMNAPIGAVGVLWVMF